MSQNIWQGPLRSMTLRDRPANRAYRNDIPTWRNATAFWRRNGNGSSRKALSSRNYSRTAPQGNLLPSVHFYTFAAERNLWLRVYGPKGGAACTVSKNRYHAREAAAALLKMAKTTSDPAVAAGLIEAATKLKEEAGELPPPVSVKAPDVQPESEPRPFHLPIRPLFRRD